MTSNPISTSILYALPMIVVLAGIHTPAEATTVLVTARHDKPGPVYALLETFKRDGTKIEQVEMRWNHNDNSFTEEDSGFLYNRPKKFRITFTNDYCCGEGGEDEDRNLFISRVRIAHFPGSAKPGIFVDRDGADWDDTGGTHPQFAGCEVATVLDTLSMEEVETAACGNGDDWVTYVMPAETPTLSSLGVVVLVSLLIAMATFTLIQQSRVGGRKV